MLICDHASSRTTEEPASHLTGGQFSHISNGLSKVKRQLLEEPDWAAVSATRPLEFAFPSVEETERFGKRRRLDENDRNRLVSATHNRSTLFELPQPQRRGRNPSSVIDTTEDIQIEINGQPVARDNDSSGLSMNSISSQSMLLDREESLLPTQDVGKENLTATWITNLFPH